jgi:hypothetical protein
MTADEQRKWREEFEMIGCAQVRNWLPTLSPEPKRQFAFRWLREEEQKKEDREAAVLEWTKRGVNVSIIAAIAAVIGAIGAPIAAWPVVRDWVVR